MSLKNLTEGGTGTLHLSRNNASVALQAREQKTRRKQLSQKQCISSKKLFPITVKKV